MSTNKLIKLLSSVREALASPDSLNPTTHEEAEARHDLIDLIPELNAALIGDVAHVRELAWSAIHVLPLSFISHHSLHHHIPVTGTITYATLSQTTSLPISLLRRILRHAMTSRLFCEPLPNHVSHSPTSRLLVTDPNLAAFVDLHTDTALKCVAFAVQAMEKWPESTDPREGAYSLSVGRPGEIGFYEDVAKDQKKTVGFGRAMQFFSSGEGYGVESLVEGYEWGRLGKGGVVVDVGGANGFASAAISKAFPDLKLIVQDIRMIEDIKVDYPDTNIEWMVHDYFTPQPVIGAEIYLYRFVFHNLCDEKVIDVLRAAIPALKFGARILINDESLSEPGKVRWRNERAARGLDGIMMACVGGRERELTDWELLFKKADEGYKFLSARIGPQSRLWLIEAEWTGS